MYQVRANATDIFFFFMLVEDTTMKIKEACTNQC